MKRLKYIIGIIPKKEFLELLDNPPHKAFIAQISGDSTLERISVNCDLERPILSIAPLKLKRCKKGLLVKIIDKDGNVINNEQVVITESVQCSKGRNLHLESLVRTFPQGTQKEDYEQPDKIFTLPVAIHKDENLGVSFTFKSETINGKNVYEIFQGKEKARKEMEAYTFNVNGTLIGFKFVPVDEKDITFFDKRMFVDINIAIDKTLNNLVDL